MEAPVPVDWHHVVRVRHRCDDDETLAGLEPGRDLVLEIPRRWGEALPDGVLLDDLLSAGVREVLDGEATAALAGWQDMRKDQLTIDRRCLPEIWEYELLAEVFLPETRIVSGLRRALADTPVCRIELEGFDELRIACLQQVGTELGIAVTIRGGAAPAPTYPSGVAPPSRVRLIGRITNAVLSTIGIPQHVRGDVYVLGYWHLMPVVEHLAHSPTHQPVMDPWYLARLDTRTRARVAKAGGWVGHPGRAARRRARRRVAIAARAAGGGAIYASIFDRLLDTRALNMLERRAGDTLASIECMRRAFRSVHVAVLPFDSPPDARSIAQAAQEVGIPTLVVQHGFYNEPNDKDRTLADAVAVWSDADVQQLAGRTRGVVTRTGNPGVLRADLLLQPKRSESMGNTLVLVEYSSRVSTRLDSRVSMRHVSAALKALARSRPGTAVTIRPHPAEHEPEIFFSLAALHQEIEVKVDTHSPIGALISSSDLCVAAVSTAALEAAVAGVPVILLNVTGSPARPPFDGSSDMPVATTSDDLAQLVPSVLASAEVRGRSGMLDALGVRADAVEQVVELIQALSMRPTKPSSSPRLGSSADSTRQGASTSRTPRHP
jgi:hypothetical protein